MRTLYLYRKIFNLISPARKRKVFFSVVLGMINSLIDVLALSSVFPAVYITSQPSIIHQNKFLSWVFNAFHFKNDDYFILCILILVLFLFLLRMILSLLILKFQQKTSFDASAELTEMMSNAFFLKNILDIKKTTIGELDKEIRFLPLQFTNFILMPLSLLVSELVVIVIILTGIVIFNLKLFLMLVVTLFPLISIFYYIVRKKIQHLGIALNKASTDSFNYSREMINGYADIKMQNKLNYFIQKLIRAIQEHNNIQVRINVYQQVIPKLLEWSALFSVVLIYIYAIAFDKSKSEIILILTVYLAAAYRLLPSLNRINSNLLLIKQYEFIIDIFEKSKKQIEHFKQNFQLSNTSPLPFQHHIILEDISLSYSKNQNELVLKNICLKINKGDIIGLVGKSGSGKTSLVYVISGLLPPTRGRIIIDNQIINEQNMSEWQRQLAFVYQDIFLINGSILENIAFGEDKDSVNIQKVWDCLRSVQMHEFVSSLPQGIDTPIGESGGYLSGGQKQRIIIARALYKNASVIIMDEATSALDESTQESVMQEISNIAQQHHLTVILIAHRISSLKYCKRIIYLENGHITKESDYAQLLSNDDVQYIKAQK